MTFHMIDRASGRNSFDPAEVEAFVGAQRDFTVTERIEIHDREDEATGFTSMERLTGFSLAIHAAWAAAGQIPTGAIRYENATKGLAFIEEIRRRGVEITTSWD